MAATKLKIQYFKNRNGEYQFRAVSRNGNIIFTSGDGYKKRHNAVKAWQSVVDKIKNDLIIIDLQLNNGD